MSTDATSLERAWHGNTAKPDATITPSSPPSSPPSPRVAPELLTDTEAAALLGMPVRKFHNLRHEEWMPAAIQLSQRALRWSRSELLEAIATRAPRTKVQEMPSHLRESRHGRRVGIK